MNNDCDSSTNPTFTDYFTDGDGDGFGLLNGTATPYCLDPGANWSTNADDCEDGEAAINPGATEICDGDFTAAAQVDNDCDSSTNPTFADYYPDSDGDGYGAIGTSASFCDAPTGFGLGADDCNDSDGTINPGATETWYDGVDQDCDGNSDYDQDGDGYDSACLLYTSDAADE